MSLLLRFVGLAIGGFLLVGGLASLVLGVLALGEHPQKGFQVTIFSLVTTGIGLWVFWEILGRKWLARRRGEVEPQVAPGAMD